MFPLREKETIMGSEELKTVSEKCSQRAKLIVKLLTQYIAFLRN